MEVKVNVISEMKKLRTTSYSDKLAWVDELVQNCQRSGATHIKVTIEGDYALEKIIVEDNGEGCSDPQVIFEKSSSDWNDDVTANESPFGEGFFSTMMIADKINVASIGFTATFDVKKMFEENTVQAIDIKSNRKKSGFTVTLTDILPEYDYMRFSIIERFKNVGKYIKKPSMSINGEIVNYEGLNPKTNHKFMHKINNEMFRGWIHPYAFGRDGYFDPSVKAFAYSRFVMKMPKSNGVNGIINLKDNVVNLRSPDRKAIVEDEKYDALMELLNEEIKKMFEKIVKNGNDKDIKDYEYYIEKYLGVQDYKKYIRFKFLSDKKQADYHKNNTPESESETESETESEFIDTDANETNTQSETNVIDTPVVTYENKQVETTATLVRNTTKNTSQKQTGDSIEKLEYGFYLRPEEATLFRDEIDVAAYYDIPIIELRNNLEATCIEEYEDIKHISDFTDTMRLRVDFTDMKPVNESETRAYKVLNTLGSLLTNRDDIFIIANTNCHKILNINEQEHIIEEVDTFATAYDNHVYINRKHMRGYQYLEDKSTTLTETDKKFILMNLETIAHELSHLLYSTEDNTKKHFERTNAFMQRIIYTMYESEYNLKG